MQEQAGQYRYPVQKQTEVLGAGADKKTSRAGPAAVSAADTRRSICSTGRFWRQNREEYLEQEQAGASVSGAPESSGIGTAEYLCRTRLDIWNGNRQETLVRELAVPVSGTERERRKYVVQRYRREYLAW